MSGAQILDGDASHGRRQTHRRHGPSATQKIPRASLLCVRVFHLSNRSLVVVGAAPARRLTRCDLASGMPEALGARRPGKQHDDSPYDCARPVSRRGSPSAGRPVSGGGNKGNLSRAHQPVIRYDATTGERELGVAWGPRHGGVRIHLYTTPETFVRAGTLQQLQAFSSSSVEQLELHFP